MSSVGTFVKWFVPPRGGCRRGRGEASGQPRVMLTDRSSGYVVSDVETSGIFQVGAEENHKERQSGLEPRATRIQMSEA